MIVGYGHAPEHVSLYCEELNVLISGDMLLPRISTNVSVLVDRSGGRIRCACSSSRSRRYRELPEDVLVLPSHGLPFRGAHARVAQLEAHHAERFAELQAACAAVAERAADVLEVLFQRTLDAHQIFFAHGRGDRPPALPVLRRAAGAQRSAPTA